MTSSCGSRPLSDVPLDAILRMIPVHNSRNPQHATAAMAIRAVNRDFLHASRLCWKSKCYAHPHNPEKMYLTEEYGDEEEVTDDEMPEGAEGQGEPEAETTVKEAASMQSSNDAGKRRTITRQRLLVELELTHPQHAATAMRILGGIY